MTRWRNASLRTLALAGVMVIWQVAVVSQFAPLGVVPDFVPVLVACVALLGGSMFGTAVGFAAGMLIDLALLQPLGVSALLLSTEGYVLGRWREQRNPVSRLVPVFAAAAGSAYFAIGFAVVQFSLGIRLPIGFGLVTQFFIATAYGALIAWPVFRIIRRVLTPVLGDNAAGTARGRPKSVTVGYRLQAPIARRGRRSRSLARGRSR